MKIFVWFSIIVSVIVSFFIFTWESMKILMALAWCSEHDQHERSKNFVRPLKPEEEFDRRHYQLIDEEHVLLMAFHRQHNIEMWEANLDLARQIHQMRQIRLRWDGAIGGRS